MNPADEIPAIVIIILYLIGMIPWWIIIARTGLPAYLGILIAIPLVQIYPLIRILFMNWPLQTELNEQIAKVKEQQLKIMELETVCSCACRRPTPQTFAA